MVILLAVLVLAVVVCVVMRVRRRTRRKITDTSGASNNLHNPTYTGSVIAERLSARHLILQHALGLSLFSVTLLIWP